jgi:hypothetical protein
LLILQVCRNDIYLKIFVTKVKCVQKYRKLNWFDDWVARRRKTGRWDRGVEHEGPRAGPLQRSSGGKLC